MTGTHYQSFEDNKNCLLSTDDNHKIINFKAALFVFFQSTLKNKFVTKSSIEFTKIAINLINSA